MNIPHYRFGSTTIAKVYNSDDLNHLLNDPWLISENIIIKPNWVSTDPGEFTDAETLRLLFEALDGRIFVTTRSANNWRLSLPAWRCRGQRVGWIDPGEYFVSCFHRKGTF